MRPSRTRKPSAKADNGSVVKANPTSSDLAVQASCSADSSNLAGCYVTRANPAHWTCIPQADTSGCGQVQAGPVGTTPVQGISHHKHLTVPKSTNNAPRVCIQANPASSGLAVGAGGSADISNLAGCCVAQTNSTRWNCFPHADQSGYSQFQAHPDGNKPIRGISPQSNKQTTIPKSAESAPRIPMKGSTSVVKADPGGRGLAVQACSSAGSYNVTAANPANCGIIPQADPPHCSRILSDPAGINSIILDSQHNSPRAKKRLKMPLASSVPPGVFIEGSGHAIPPDRSAGSCSVTRANLVDCNIIPQVTAPRSRSLAGPAGSDSAILDRQVISTLANARPTLTSPTRVSPSVPVKADAAGSGHAIPPDRSASSCSVTRANRADYNIIPQVTAPRSLSLAGPAGSNSAILDRQVISTLADAPPAIPSPTRVSPGVPVKGSSSSIHVNPAGSRLAARGDGSTGRSNPNQLVIQGARAISAPTTSPDDQHVALNKSQCKTSLQRRPPNMPHVTKGKATTATPPAPPPTPIPHLNVCNRKSMPFSCQQQQDPPIVDHIRREVSGIFEDPPLELLGERCQLCGIDMAFTSSGSVHDGSVHAVLPCSHCFHYSCLESVFGPPESSQIPPCFRCMESRRQN